MKKLLTFFMFALLAFSVGWAATVTITMSQQGWTNGEAVTSVTSGDVTITFNKGTASNAPAYYNTGTGVRLYNNGSYMTVSAGGNTISSIELTFSGTGYTGEFSSDVGSYSLSNATGTWTGSNTSVTLTNVKTGSGHARLQKVTVTYVAASVNPPTISPESGDFLGSMEVSISHLDADHIYYTTNGDDPTTSSTEYSGSFTISQTTTVKAIAEKNGVTSTVASATYTKKPSAATIAEALAITPSTSSYFTFTGDGAVVTAYDGQNYMWIRDNTGSGVIYFRSDDALPAASYPVGTVLSPNWEATRLEYNGLHEFRCENNTTFSPSSTTQSVEPYERNSITSANMNEYVSVSGLTISGITTFNNKTQYSTSEGITLEDHFGQYPNLTTGKTYDITGVVYYNTNQSPSLKLYIISATEVQSGDPTLIASPTSLTINDSGTGNTFAVNGSNLGNDNAGVTHTNPDFAISLSATTGSTYNYDGGSYIGFTPANGEVSGTVAMSYTGRQLSASDNVTVANNVANASAAVNYVADLYIVTDNGVTGDWHFDGTYGEHMTHDNGVYTATFTAVNPITFILFARKLGDGVTWNTRYVFGPSSGGDWWLPASGNGNGTIDLNTSHPIRIQDAGTYIITINANAGTFTITKEAVTEGDFSLVTDASELNTGDEVIFVSSDTQGDWLAMSTTQNNNNRGTTNVTVTPALKVTATETTQIATLEGDATGWYFNVGNGYLYAASSSSNYLRTRTERGDDNAKASISISNHVASIVFQGSNTRNVMQFNTNGTIVSCYGSATQNPVYLYRREASTPPEPSITVEPTSLDLVIPAGDSSMSGSVAVTETNTTGTTSVDISGTGASYFNATLENGTLTVTYSGTATQANPDQATITLTNGTATATVTVTGYKRVQATGTLYTKVTSADQIQDGLQYILVFEGYNNMEQEALNGITTGGTGATVVWETPGSVVNISGTDVIEFTLNGNATGFTLSSDHGYLNPNTPGLAFDDEDGTQWSADIHEGGYVIKWGDYMLRYNTGMSSPNNGRFRLYTSQTGQPVYLYVQGEAGLATPVITPASGSYPEDQQVTITCSTTGATIYYTVDGGETQTYSAPFTVELDEDHTSVTVEAWAEKDNETSEHVTATYTYREYGVNSIAEFLALNEGDSAYFKNPVVVLFDYSQNSAGGQEYIWIKDRTGYTQLFISPQFDDSSFGGADEFVPKYENGDVIPAGFKVKKEYYSNGQYYQGQCYDTHDSFQDATEKALADPEQVTLSELLANPANYNNRYLYINKVQVSNVSNLNFSIAADENGDDFAEVQGGSAIVGYNKYNSPAWKDKSGETIGVTLPNDSKFYNVTFIFQQWQNGYEIMPIEFTEWEETSLRLEDLVEIGEENNSYTISNPLIAAAVTWDDNKGKFAIFAKDDEMFANKSYPGSDMKAYRIDFVNNDQTFTNEVYQEDYDQSNWIEILIPNDGNITNKTSNPSGYLAQLDELKALYENKILPGGSIRGQYVDAFNPTIDMTTAPAVETSSTYNPNIYCTGNFLMENLDADGATSYLGNEYGGQFFMMDGKPQEFCMVVWAYFIGDDNYFVAPAREGTDINGYQFHGSFLADMSLCRETYIQQDSPVSAGFLPSNNTTPETLYGFNAIVRKNPASSYWSTAPNGAPHRIQPYTDGKENVPAYIVYPLNAQESSNGNVTAVKELTSARQVESVRYYNVMGMESSKPFEGVNIVVTRYTDGTTSTVKVLK